MDDVSARVRRALERIEPSPTAFQDTLGLVRRRQRNRRFGAGMVGLLLTAAVAVGLWASIGHEGGTPGASPTPSTTDAVPSLFLAGSAEAWIVDLDSGSARRIEMPELSAGDPSFHAVRRDGKIVAWGDRTTYVLDPERAFAPTVLSNDSWFFIPSAVEDRVWVGVLDEESGTARRLRAVREVSIDGEITVPDVAPPQGLWPVAAVNEGLVFQKGNELIVWDWRTGTIVDRLDGQYPLAWRGDVLAWCGGDCQTVNVTDFATGDHFSFGCPAGTLGFDGYTGAFSPDGKMLALSLRLDWGPESRRALTLVDAGSGALDVVDGTNVDAGYVYVDWSPSGDAAFISGGSEQRVLIEYRPAQGDARMIPVEVGQFYGIAAI